LRPRFVFLEGRCSAAVIPHGKLSGMADGRAQDPFAIAARPSCDDGGGRVSACAHPVSGRRRAAVGGCGSFPVAGPSGDQASVAGGGDEDGIGRVFWRHVGLQHDGRRLTTQLRKINHLHALVGRPLGANSMSFII
jgi:hypothetical protein